MFVYRCKEHPDVRKFDASATEIHDWTVDDQGNFIRDQGCGDAEVRNVRCPECGRQAERVEMPPELVTALDQIRVLKLLLTDLLGDNDIVIRRPGGKVGNCQWCGCTFVDDEEGIPELCPSDDCAGHKARLLLAEEKACV